MVGGDGRYNWGDFAPSDATSTESARSIFMRNALEAPSPNIPGVKTKQDWRAMENLGLNASSAQAVHDVTLDQMLMGQGALQLGSALGKTVGTASRDLVQSIVARQARSKAVPAAQSSIDLSFLDGPPGMQVKVIPDEIRSIVEKSQNTAKNFLTDYYSKEPVKNKVMSILEENKDLYYMNPRNFPDAVENMSSRVKSLGEKPIQYMDRVSPLTGNLNLGGYHTWDNFIDMSPTHLKNVFNTHGERGLQEMAELNLTHELTHGVDSRTLLKASIYHNDPKLFTGEVGRAPYLSRLLHDRIGGIMTRHPFGDNPDEVFNALAAKGNPVSPEKIKNYAEYVKEPTEVMSRMNEIKFLARDAGVPDWRELQGPFIDDLGNFIRKTSYGSGLNSMVNMAGGPEGLRALARILPAAGAATVGMGVAHGQ